MYTTDHIELLNHLKSLDDAEKAVQSNKGLDTGLKDVRIKASDSLYQVYARQMFLYNQWKEKQNGVQQTLL